VKETLALSSPIEAITLVGAFGIVDGVTALDATDEAEVPIPFVAVTLKVYGSPFVKPLIAHVSVGAEVLHVPAELFSAVYAVTVYPVTAEPLMLIGGSQEMVAEAFDATAVTLIGTEGAAFIAILVDADEADEVPIALVAVALKV